MLKEKWQHILDTSDDTCVIDLEVSCSVALLNLDWIDLFPDISMKWFRGVIWGHIVCFRDAPAVIEYRTYTTLYTPLTLVLDLKMPVFSCYGYWV